MLRLILIFTLIAAAAPAQEAQPLRRAVALLDYVTGDYARAVGPHGEVLSAAEHQEQIGFVEDAAREVRADAGAAGEDIARRLESLAQEVARRAPPERVAAQAQALREEIVQRFHVVLLPQKAPDVAHGARVYAQACAACHGATGHPNLTLGLPTKPPDFSVPDEVKSFTPQRVFSAATYGVPNTAMPAFDTGLDEQSRWDVAFYVLTLVHPGASPRGLELARAALVPTNYHDLAALSDEQLRARLAAAGLSQAQQEEALAALRAGPFSEPVAAGAQGLLQARQEIQKAVARAHAGDREGARRDLIGAYLDHFEPLEPALRARDAQLVTSIESAFLALRAAVEGGKDIDSAAARLDSLLEKADTSGPRGGLIAFVAALAIVLREGVESALLVAALLALLRKAGRQHDANAVHAGWVSALAAGAITWWGSGLILAHISGSHRELIEGVLQIVLAALIVYASHWLFAAMHSQRLISMFFQRSMAGAGAAIVLGITFIAVYREMFETVLFFRGLMLESPGAGGAVALGALTGLLALVALVALFQRVGRRLKARPLLITCGVLLCGMAVLMVGNGVRALQIQGALPLTVWGAFQIPGLGIYATREGVLAQALVLVLLGASALWTTRRPGRRAKDEAAAPA